MIVYRFPTGMRPRLQGLVLGIVLLSSATLGVVSWFRSRPVWTAHAFLSACQAGDHSRMYTLCDPQYRAVFAPASGERFLRVLHRFLPRRYRIVGYQQPSRDGLVSDRRRYSVRVEFEEPLTAKATHRSFVLTLVQNPHGNWFVAFEPTYASLFSGLYGASGEQFLRQAVWQAGGPEGHRLWNWRGDPTPARPRSG